MTYRLSFTRVYGIFLRRHMTYPYITRNCVRNFVIFFFFISIRNSRHSETQIWLTNSFFFVCCDFWGNSPIGKINFFLALFFSLFRCCVFWPFIARYFFLREKKQSSHYDVTLSHFQIDFFHFLDWIGGTAQLLISYNYENVRKRRLVRDLCNNNNASMK